MRDQEETQDGKVTVMDPLLKRLACLVELAERKRDRPGRLGKTTMQKLHYLLQEVYGVDLGYTYELYTYGPYAASVMRDIDYAAALGLLHVEYDYQKGYKILPGDNAAEVNAERQELRSTIGEKMNGLLDRFGSQSARELELRATLAYIIREDPSIENADLRDRIMAIKPKYDDAEIDAAIKELEENGVFGELRGAG